MFVVTERCSERMIETKILADEQRPADDRNHFIFQAGFLSVVSENFIKKFRYMYTVKDTGGCLFWSMGKENCEK